MLTIAVDAMSGDLGAAVTIPAAFQILSRYKDVALSLVGQESVLAPMLSAAPNGVQSRFKLHHASEVIGMDENPLRAMRAKKDASMRVAIQLVKDNLASACVSAGNTGALVALSHYLLRPLSVIERPGLIAPFPTQKKNQLTWVIDLGANPDVTSHHLIQFAVMGSALLESVHGISRPRVGLLNIGVEASKGNVLVKETHEKLSQMPSLHFIGYVEGDDLYHGNVDLIICDGFVGNIMLKSNEGLANWFSHQVKNIVYQNIWMKFQAFLAQSIFRQLKQAMDPARYNGACLLGLNGVVIKSHGKTSVEGFAHAIEEAILQAKQHIPEKIAHRVQQVLESS